MERYRKMSKNCFLNHGLAVTAELAVETNYVRANCKARGSMGWKKEKGMTS